MDTTTEKASPTAIDVAGWIKARGYAILGPRVGVFRDEAPTVSKGGILIPDTSRGRLKKATGTIVALGKHLDPEYSTYARLGSRVVFGKYEALDFLITDEETGVEYIIDILHQTDIYFLQHPEDDDAWIQIMDI